MRPLIKKGMLVKYRMGKEIKEAKVYHSRRLNVWIEDDKGRVVRLHRKYHRVEIIEREEMREERGGKKPSKALDDLLKKVKKKSSG